MKKIGTENIDVTIDGTSGKPYPTPRLNLSSFENIRQEMSRVYRDMRSHEIDPQEGSRLIYGLTSISKVLELEHAELHQRQYYQVEPENSGTGDSLLDVIHEIELGKLNDDELTELEAATLVIERIRFHYKKAETVEQLRNF